MNEDTENKDIMPEDTAATLRPDESLKYGCVLDGLGRRPYIAADVHYVQSNKGEPLHFAAKVVVVNKGGDAAAGGVPTTVDLILFPNHAGSIQAARNVPEDQDGKGIGSWHWPELPEEEESIAAARLAKQTKEREELAARRRP